MSRNMCRNFEESIRKCFKVVKKFPENPEHIFKKCETNLSEICGIWEMF